MSVEDQTRIDDHLRETIAQMMGFTFPMQSLFRTAWEGLSADAVEKATRAFLTYDLPEIMAYESRKVRRARGLWLDGLAESAITNGAAAAVVDPERIANCFLVERLTPKSLPPSGDLVLTKINHGFWEQLFLICNDGYDPHITRPTGRRGFTESYLDSRFVDALVHLCRNAALVEDDTLRFQGLDLGISFNSGDFWHKGLMRRVSQLEEERLRIIRGVEAGLGIFQSQMPPASRARFFDGALAKQGLTDGTLDSLLGSVAATVDHLAFVVPGHLSALRLAALPAECQQILHVSSRHVHHAWPLMLAGTARPLLARLAAGAHVAVIVQAAVFSALLPFYLVQAKTALGLPGRLTFLDLGQALDVFSPESGGVWIERTRKTITGLTTAIETVPGSV